MVLLLLQVVAALLVGYTCALVSTDFSRPLSALHHDDAKNHLTTLAAVAGLSMEEGMIEAPAETDNSLSSFRSSIVYSAPKSVFLMLNSPAINSFVLVNGWSQEDSLQRFTNAVSNVVLENPVLTGKATGLHLWNLWRDPQIGVDRGHFKASTGHSFVQTIDGTNLPSPQEHQGTALLLDYMHKNVAPLIGPHDTTIQQILKGSPLFDAKVVLLPDDYACICVKLSHCIGDFITYYEIMDQISSFDKGKDDQGVTVHSINWENQLMPNHELVPDELSERDYERLYGTPFLIGLMKHMPFMFQRKKEVILLSKNKIKKKQRELRAKTGCINFTSNEVIMAALCDANRSTDIFAFTRSMRGIKPGLGLRDGGNLLNEISFQRSAGRNPLVIKDILARGRFFEPNEVPLWESLMGRVGRISNCIAPTNLMSFGGCKPLVYGPPQSFLDFTPLDTAIVFRASQHHDAILHNFKEMNRDSELLLDIMASSDDGGNEE